MKISETEVDYDGLHAFLEIIIWCVALMVCACTVTGIFDYCVTPYIIKLCFQTNVKLLIPD